MTDEQANKFKGTMQAVKPAVTALVGAFAFGPAVRGLTSLTGVMGTVAMKQWLSDLSLLVRSARPEASF